MRVFLGSDPQEEVAREVARRSIARYTHGVDMEGLSRLTLGLAYTRPTELRQGQLWDVISEAPMSTEHAIARFFVPWLCGYRGWALFLDGDILCRRNLTDLFALADARYAVQCVQHPVLSAEGTKKDGAVQQAYPRKNWSSVLLFNCGHPANRALTLHTLNTWTGRALHAFNWLDAAFVGPLPPMWNWLVHVSPLLDDPAIVHYTLGLPNVPGHNGDPYADEWWEIAREVTCVSV